MKTVNDMKFSATSIFGARKQSKQVSGKQSEQDVPKMLSADGWSRKAPVKENDQLFVERRPDGNYAVRRTDAERVSAVVPTQAEAIKRARELNAPESPLIEVRHVRIELHHATEVNRNECDVVEAIATSIAEDWCELLLPHVDLLSPKRGETFLEGFAKSGKIRRRGATAH